MAAKSICVFAGSSSGSDPQFASAARALGSALVAKQYGLVYGGASVGLMGIVADSVLAGGGHVVGVMPEFLATKEIAHAGLSDLKVTASMHERKQTMATLADGFVALPGGYGTLEEFFEMITWAQLGLHAKPCALLNVNGYYDSLLSFIDTAVKKQFLKPANRAMILVSADPTELLDQMQRYTAPTVTKWISLDRT
ncbi:MAG: TIGR00730 family Rossman fold protein [Gammaproteobacteria bacterium]